MNKNKNHAQHGGGGGFLFAGLELRDGEQSELAPHFKTKKDPAC